MISRACMVIVGGALAACEPSSARTLASRDASVPAPLPPPAPVAAPPPVVAAAPPAPACSNLMELSWFGTVAAPPGWCWRRNANGIGEEVYGDIVDDKGVVRGTYDFWFPLLGPDEHVDEPCRALSAERRKRQRAHGVSYWDCALPNGHSCKSFDGRFIACSTDPDAGALWSELSLTAGPTKKPHVH